jgi:ketopantoate reductase
MQNGVGNEDPFRSTYSQNTIISGVVWIGATQTSPGLIKHMQAENTEIGLFSNPGSDPKQEESRLENLASIMQQGGTNISVEENVQVKRWEKVVWNAAWNTIGEFVQVNSSQNARADNFAVRLTPAAVFPERDRNSLPLSRSISEMYHMLTKIQQTTLTFVDTQTWLASPEAMEMTKRLMLEVISVGQRCGVPLKNELVDVLMTRILSLPGIFSSMYVDAKEGRNLEIDVILGFPMKKAKEFGMDVPTLATLYALLKAVDGRLGV